MPNFLHAEIDCKDPITTEITHNNISAVEAYTLQKSGIPLIDIRSHAEYGPYHAKGSINIPAWEISHGKRYWNKNFLNTLDTLIHHDHNAPILMICKTGLRTHRLSAYLTDLGYTNIYNVEPGFDTETHDNDWCDEDLPVVY